MKDARILIIAAAMLTMITAAIGGSSTISLKDGGGTTRNYDVITDGSGNYVGMMGVCDGTAAAQCATVKPASTAPIASDPAMVVSISPNSGTALAANQSTAAAQGSTTSGQTGSLVQGAVTVGAPTYTAATTDPLSLDTSGNMRVNCMIGCSGGGTGSAVTMQNAATGNGNGVTLSVTNYVSALVNVNCSVACSGGTTINFEGTDSQGTFFQIAAIPVNGASGSVNTATTSGQFCLPVANFTSIRARISNYSAGTITVVGQPSQGATCSINQVVNANNNGQTTMTNSSPVVLPSNQQVGDPCMFQAKTNAAFSSASGTFALVTGVASKRVYVCSLSLVVPSAVSVSLAEGSSATCGTSGQAAVMGVATNGTAGNGLAMAANGGLTLGNGGGTVAQTATPANYLCVFQSGTAQIAGNITYVQQ
jgi:hypothetical protein